MGRQISLTIAETFISMDCPSCGVPFAVTKRFNDCRRENKENFYCPNGHHMSYTESEADGLRRERDRLVQRLAERDDEVYRQRELREAAERQLVAAKGQATKLRKRASVGVCPCCNRTFRQLARHMAQKHPRFAVEGIPAGATVQ